MLNHTSIPKIIHKGQMYWVYRLSPLPYKSIMARYMLRTCSPRTHPNSSVSRESSNMDPPWVRSVSANVWENSAFVRRLRTAFGRSPFMASRRRHFDGSCLQRCSSGTAHTNSMIRRSFNGDLSSIDNRAESRSPISFPCDCQPLRNDWQMSSCAKL